LTDPIQPIPVKPLRLFATINSNGTMTMSGYIRVSLFSHLNKQQRVSFTNIASRSLALSKPTQTAPSSFTSIPVPAHAPNPSPASSATTSLLLLPATSCTATLR
jgi:hypothetical protein